jgi:hypothetical protein
MDWGFVDGVVVAVSKDGPELAEERVVTLFREQFGYDYLVGWPRLAHSNRG